MSEINVKKDTQEKKEGKTAQNITESPDYNEWKASLDNISRFDSTLLDLRKYGFSFLTGLSTANGFLGFATPSASIRIASILTTMILVVIIYWLDKYYFSLLYGSYLRAIFLEKYKLDMGLSRYIGGTNPEQAKGVLIIIYSGFLVALFVMGLYAIETDPYRINLVSLIVGLIGTISVIIYSYYHIYKVMLNKGKCILNEFQKFDKEHSEDKNDIKKWKVAIDMLEKKIYNILFPPEPDEKK